MHGYESVHLQFHLGASPSRLIMNNGSCSTTFVEIISIEQEMILRGTNCRETDAFRTVTLWRLFAPS